MKVCRPWSRWPTMRGRSGRRSDTPTCWPRSRICADRRMADHGGRWCAGRLARLAWVGLAIAGKLAHDIAEVPAAMSDMRCVMTLRERLQELAGFTDDDFDHRDGSWAVALV